MTQEELQNSVSKVATKLQDNLRNEILLFMEHNGMNKAQLAEYLGCTKGYVTQLLNGEFDHKLSKFVELSLAIGKVPEIRFTEEEE